MNTFARQFSEALYGVSAADGGIPGVTKRADEHIRARCPQVVTNAYFAGAQFNVHVRDAGEHSQCMTDMLHARGARHSVDLQNRLLISMLSLLAGGFSCADARVTSALRRCSHEAPDAPGYVETRCRNGEWVWRIRTPKHPGPKAFWGRHEPCSRVR